MTSLTSVRTDAGDMPAHLFLPARGSGPGIVLVQEIFGVSSYIRGRAQDLAELGYVVLVPELYWRVGVSAVAEGPDALQQGMAIMGRVRFEDAVADTTAALQTLRARAEVVGGVGLVGFCYGGGVAFAVAASASPPPDCLVSYYGSALPGLLDAAPSVTMPSLHHFGLADSYLDEPTVRRIEAAVTPQGARVETYEGADHAFDNVDFVGYDAEASALAWSRTEAFLAEVLPVPS